MPRTTKEGTNFQKLSSDLHTHPHTHDAHTTLIINKRILLKNRKHKRPQGWDINSVVWHLPTMQKFQASGVQRQTTTIKVERQMAIGKKKAERWKTRRVKKTKWYISVWKCQNEIMTVDRNCHLDKKSLWAWLRGIRFSERTHHGIPFPGLCKQSLPRQSLLCFLTTDEYDQLPHDPLPWFLHHQGL